MRNKSDILEELRCADAILARAGRDRPHGVRSALCPRTGGIEPNDHQIRWALHRSCAVIDIVDPLTRRVVSLAMFVIGGEPVYSRRGLAEVIGKSEETVTRRLRAGCQEVSRRLRGSVVVPI
jgi:hypothetical protein